jgi:hypothetical protein
MAATLVTIVAGDASSTDGGAISAGKSAVTIGMSANGRGLLTATTRRPDIMVTIPLQDITVTTCRVIRAWRKTRYEINGVEPLCGGDFSDLAERHISFVA